MDFTVPYEYSEMIDLEGVITELLVADISDEEQVEALTAWVERVGGKLADWMVDWMTGPPGPVEAEVEVEVEVG